MNSHDDQTEARVRAAFAAELRQAESDLELSPLKVSSRKSYSWQAAGTAPKQSVLGVAAGSRPFWRRDSGIPATLMVARPWNSAMPETQSPSASASEIASPSAATPSATSSIRATATGYRRPGRAARSTVGRRLAMRTTAKDDAPST